jgi:hypothetical protein
LLWMTVGSVVISLIVTIAWSIKKVIK